MSISEKLLTIAENEQKVFEAGYEKGKSEGGDTDAAYEQGKAEGIEQGKKAEYDAFWDVYQQNGNREIYEHAFATAGWTDVNFKPKYDIRPKGNSINQMFYQSGVQDVKGICERQGITLDFSQVDYASQPLYQSQITRLPTCDISRIPNLSTFFHTMRNLAWVDKVILGDDGTQIFGNGVGYHWTLYSGNVVHFPIQGKIGTNVYFNSFDKIDDETTQSIIDALMDLTGQTSQQVIFHSKVLAKLTEEQLSTISSKNWTT